MSGSTQAPSCLQHAVDAFESAIVQVYKAAKGRTEAERLYLEELGKAINAQLAVEGKSFCRWASHVVAEETKIVYVTGIGRSDCRYFEILPICSECLNKPEKVCEAELREDGWYYRDNLLWQHAGDPGLPLKVLLYPEGPVLESLAQNLGLTPPSHFKG